MKIENSRVKLTSLFPAPWNPREAITVESVADLAANIKANGLLHNIGVWKDPTSGGLFVIYGNRRAIACESIGMAEVDAKVYSDCSEAEAQLLTRAENELRLDIDPLKDAELLGQLRKSGMNEKEIAAHFALPIAKVCRRLKLVSLSEQFRKLIADGYKFTTEALEQISAYPEDIQQKCADEMNKRLLSDDGRYAWSDIRYLFDYETKDLSNQRFDLCETCPKRTGAMPDLFGEITGDDYGRCLDGACFKRLKEEELQKKVDSAIAQGVTERVKVKEVYNLANYGSKKKPDAKNPTAYWAESWDGKISVVYGPSVADRKKAESISRKASATRKKHEKEREERREKISSKYRAWFKNNIENVMREFCDDSCLSFVEVMIFFGISGASYSALEAENAQMKFSLDPTFETWWEVCGQALLMNNYRFTGASMIPRTMKFLSSIDWGDVFSHDDLEFINSEDFLK